MDVSLVFDQLPDLVVCRDGDRVIELVNQAFVDAFGHDANSWVGKTLDGSTSGAQIGAFDDNRTYGHILISDKLHWIEWNESKLSSGGSVAIGRINIDRRKQQRSSGDLARDRRRNVAKVYGQERSKPVPTIVEAPSLPPSSPTTPPTAKSAERILLAEDDLLNAKLACTLLERTGCVVTHVENGKEAVQAAKDHDFDLVFMDIRMPFMDGLTATRAIRALGGKWMQTPIVALTANAFAEDKKSCHAAGMNGFLTKPISIDALYAAKKRWTNPQSQVKTA